MGCAGYNAGETYSKEREKDAQLFLDTHPWHINRQQRSVCCDSGSLLAEILCPRNDRDPKKNMRDFSPSFYAALWAAGRRGYF